MMIYKLKKKKVTGGEQTEEENWKIERWQKRAVCEWENEEQRQKGVSRTDERIQRKGAGE